MHQAVLDHNEAINGMIGVFAQEDRAFDRFSKAMSHFASDPEDWSIDEEPEPEDPAPLKETGLWAWCKERALRMMEGGTNRDGPR